ncbi:LytR family transcriptional regulator [Paenibacillus pectinilyticus]|uniref:LytR family transcriptional regulator n=1 Tax=Paenibacillus pectinilyticus TaxID=512399 RepID=A0A1C0ZSM5_9BACL|nr:LCP family protein [Paenibacillus pectinilyticus]OCT11023.1 LytR family transcriptional regulator [Paenibacillus pectinilyticus]
MRRWVVYTAGFLFVGIIGIGGTIYWKYEPSHHFQQVTLPVLSKPAVSTETTTTIAARKEESEPTVQPSTQAPTKVVKAFNVLLLGIDARGDEDSRSDVIMVLHIMPDLRKVNIISIPRDSRVQVEGVGYTKINHAHLVGEMKGGNEKGTQEALQTVSDFLDVPINYYMKTNFKGFEDFIDTIGGVNVEVKNDIYLLHSQTTLPKGMQHIDGKLALSLARERYAFPDGDFGRQTEQSQILKNVAQEVLRPEHIGEIASLLTKVKKDIVDTNFQDSDIISLAWLFKGMTSEDFTTMQIPGHSGYELDPLTQLRLYFWIPDLDKVKEISSTLLKN